MVFGAGFALSDFYAKSTNLRNGKPARGSLDPGTTGCASPTIGACAGETDQYGKTGRPDPERQTNFVLNGGVGQKFHFFKRMHLTAELRNYTLLGTNEGFQPLLAQWGGFGVRL